MGNSCFSANTNYQLIYTKRTLYNNYQIFRPFKLVFVGMPPDWLNLAFPQLEQFVNAHKDCLQLLQEKAEFIEVFC